MVACRERGIHFLSSLCILKEVVAHLLTAEALTGAGGESDKKQSGRDEKQITGQEQELPQNESLTVHSWSPEILGNIFVFVSAAEVAGS